MSNANPTPIALIIGASRGLGLAMAAEYLKRGWHVVGTVRGTAKTGLHELAAQSKGKLEIESIDIADDKQIAALRKRLDGRSFDLLFVNSGVANGPGDRVGDTSTEEFTRVMVTNALGPIRVIESFETLVPKSGMIGVMSSGLGSVADNTSGGWEVYRASKAALNTLMRSFAASHADDPRAMIIMTPGWVRTDMGGSNASLGIEDSIPRVVDVLMAQAGKPGLRFLNYRGETNRW